jgi:DNA-binding CsgD family transcriptional regulator
MNRPVLRIIVLFSICTAAIILLFEACNLLLVYKYFKVDYYLRGVAIFFLVAGYLISKRKYSVSKQINIDADPFLELTNKELYILQLIVEGKSNKEIAAINFVEVSTIKTHINNIYTKLGLDNRKAAINTYKNKFTEQYNSNIHPFST